MIEFDKWYLTNNSTRAELLADIAELTQTPYYKIIDGTPELLHAELIMIQSDPLKIKYRTKYYPKYHKAIVERYLPSITTPTKSYKEQVYKINDNEPLYKVKGENKMDIKELLFNKRNIEERELDERYKVEYTKFLTKTRIAKTAIPYLKEAAAISILNGFSGHTELYNFIDDSLLLPEEREKKSKIQARHGEETKELRDKYEKIEFLFNEAKSFNDKIRVLYTYGVIDITEASGLLSKDVLGNN